MDLVVVGVKVDDQVGWGALYYKVFWHRVFVKEFGTGASCRPRDD